MATPFQPGDWLPPMTHLPNGWPLPPMPPLPPSFPEPDPPHILKECLVCGAFLHIKAADVCRECEADQGIWAYRHHWLFLTARYLRGELKS